MKNKLSVVIPSRNEKFLQPTIKELFKKAEGEIEIIVTLDGYWPEPALEEDDRLKIVHKGESEGMRSAINSAVAIAEGEYIMKIDAHCMVDEGFDTKLKADCEDNWVVVPRRKRLDADNWCITDLKKPDIDYMYLSYPDDPQDRGGAGLHGRVWKQKNATSKDDGIVDLMSAQGSCYFMKKSYYHELELLDEENYGPFGSEFQEVGFKCWLSGGRVVRNKKTWYAHLHKGKKHGRGYFLNNKDMAKANAYTNKWINFKEAWDKQTIPLQDHVRHFWPLPEWTEENFKELFGEDLNTIEAEIEEKYINANNMTSRIDLAKFFNQKGYKVGAEIGVADGRYAEILCQEIPNLKLYCVDLYAPYGDSWRTQESQDKAFEQASKKLEKYNASIIRDTSLKGSLEIKDESLDFVFIDGGHTFDDAMLDIILWSKKVKRKGIVSGHDFCHFSNSGVIEAINKYTEIHKLELNLINRNPNNHKDDRQPCWFFVKK